MQPNWKTGFEIELLAPRGKSRRDLAEAVAAKRGGRVNRLFHAQSEPSQVAGQPTFENLTQGFEALDAEGKPLGRFVDDVTLQAGLERKTAPRPGWYRIISDDGRLIRLIQRQCDADAGIDTVLDPIAALFGTRTQPPVAGMIRLLDQNNASIAIAAPLPGERERTCEIVTPALDADQEAALGFLLGEARALGFTLPREGATHIHFDATPLLSALAIARLVELFSIHGAALKTLVRSNPNCIRLGHWPDELRALTRTPRFRALDWPEARKALSETGVKKYCDYNLFNIAFANAAKHTFEVRVLPAGLNAEAIVDAAELFSALLHWCVDETDATCAVPAALDQLLTSLPLSARSRRRWKP